MALRTVYKAHHFQSGIQIGSNSKPQLSSFLTCWLFNILQLKNVPEWTDGFISPRLQLKSCAVGPVSGDKKVAGFNPQNQMVCWSKTAEVGSRSGWCRGPRRSPHFLFLQTLSFRFFTCFGVLLFLFSRWASLICFFRSWRRRQRWHHRWSVKDRLVPKIASCLIGFINTLTSKLFAYYYF